MQDIGSCHSLCKGQSSLIMRSSFTFVRSKVIMWALVKVKIFKFFTLFNVKCCCTLALRIFLDLQNTWKLRLVLFEVLWRNCWSDVTIWSHEQGGDWDNRGNYLCSTEHHSTLPQTEFCGKHMFATNTCLPQTEFCGKHRAPRTTQGTKDNTGHLAGHRAPSTTQGTEHNTGHLAGHRAPSTTQGTKLNTPAQSASIRWANVGPM